MEAILNELSVSPADGVSPDQRLLALAEAIRALRRLGVASPLYLTRDVLDRPVSAQESMREWLFAYRTVHREARQLILSALQKAPFVEALLAQIERDTGQLVDIRHKERPAPGLSLAFLIHSVAVSLLGNADFTATELPVEMTVLVDSGELDTTSERVLNVWDSASVQTSRSSIVQRVIGAVTSGEQAWASRTQLFSHLEWSREAESHLRSLLGSELVFNGVVERLVALNQYTAAWSGGPFEPPLKFSTEAEGTLHHGRLGAERECTLASGETKRLSLHIKLTDFWRIYFEFRQVVDERTTAPRGRALVGYIGKHLRL